MNKIILITGGNRGIGLETCRQLAAQGHTIIMGSRDVSKGQEAAGKLEGNITVKKLEVTSEADMQALEKELQDEYGKLDVLINNAGVFSEESVMDTSTEEMRRVFESNVYAPLRMVQVFTPLLRKSDDPRIINLSSAMGMLSEQFPNSSAYRLSKFALNGLTIQLAHELTDIKVNSMHPGWVRTDMGGSSAPLSVEEGADTAVWLATAEEIPTGKFFGERREKNW